MFICSALGFFDASTFRKTVFPHAFVIAMCYECLQIPGWHLSKGRIYGFMYYRNNSLCSRLRLSWTILWAFCLSFRTFLFPSFLGPSMNHVNSFSDITLFVFQRDFPCKTLNKKSRWAPISMNGNWQPAMRY